VQITDVAADVRASLSIEDALARLASAHRQRAARISWEGESPGPA
jgi:hypothetical protein